MADENYEEPIIGERPFNAEERYQLRRFMKLFGDMTPDEISELRTLAHSGKATRTIIGFLAKFILFLSGSLGLLTLAKGWWKGGAI